MRTLFRRVLAFLARLTLRRYRPMIVGVSGNVGKTSAKEAIFEVLKAKYRVRRSEKNYNTEIGVPLTILGIPHHGRNILKWLFVLIRSVIRVLISVHEYPQILVLEMAADRPGDIEYLVKLAPPFIGVITAVGEIPVHVEFFSGPQAVAEEKSKLIQSLPKDGFAILNYDDAAVRNIRQRTSAAAVSFGFGSGADLRISDYQPCFPSNHAGYKFERSSEFVTWGNNVPGINFNLEYKGNVVPVRLKNTFGKPQAYAAAAASAVGLALKMNLAEIAEALGRYESPPGRLKLLYGNKNALILDDTYNASPAATIAALEVLAAFPGKRRIAVLGDMLELGEYTETAHRLVGEKAADIADIFVGVGERMKFSLDEANGKEHHWFASSREAGQALDNMLRPGDVVLIKGSQSMRMERAVEELMAEPQKAGELLVRQAVDWLRR